MTRLVVGYDAAWGGCGWCIATQHGPLEAGHVVPGSASTRMVRLQAFLQALDHRIVEHQLSLDRDDPLPRVAVERLPWSYKRPGSQVRTVYGISGCAHMIAAHYCRQDWLHPWLIPPMDDRGKQKPGAKPRAPAPGWRQWWDIRGKGRWAKKLDAIRKLKMHGWGDLLWPLPKVHHFARVRDRPPGPPVADVNENGDGPRGDLAEGILIAVGAARNHLQGPATPREWPDFHLAA